MATPLLAVTLLFRSKPEFEALPHVIDSVSVFLDSSVEVPLRTACNFQSFKLLDRIWDSEVDLAMDDTSRWSVRRLLRTNKYYQQYQFHYALLTAVGRSDLETTRWLFERFPDCYVVVEVVEEAARAGALDILRYFREMGFNPNAETDDDVDDADVDLRGGSREIYWGFNDVVAAAEAGHRDVVMFLHEMPSIGRTGAAIMHAAVANGDMQLVDWLRTLAHFPMDTGVHEAAANGHLEMVQRWFSMYPRDPRGAGVLLKAAENGRLDIVRWLIDRDWNDEDLDSDSSSDSDRGYEYGRNKSAHITSLGCEASFSIHAAAINGHLEVAQFLHARVDEPIVDKDWSIRRDRENKTLKNISAQLGQHHQGQRIGSETMLEASRCGLLDVVQWLYAEFGANFRVDLFRDSSSLARYLDDDVSDGVPTLAMDAAACEGHLAVLQFLHSIVPLHEAEIARDRKRSKDSLAIRINEKRKERCGIRCSTDAMDRAAANNHLEVVKWLHENRPEGCTARAMDAAAATGHLEMLQWLHTNRSEGCTARAMDFAAMRGQLDVVKWLHENTSAGCTTDAMDLAADHVDVVRFLHENRTEGCTSDAMNYAAEHGSLDVLKFLHRNRSEGCSEYALSLAAESGHVQVMQWLLDHYPSKSWDPAIDDAAKRNQLESVLFLHYIRKETLSSDVASDPEVLGCPGLKDFIREQVQGAVEVDEQA